jgi:hypothetical protein
MGSSSFGQTQGTGRTASSPSSMQKGTGRGREAKYLKSLA